MLVRPATAERIRRILDRSPGSTTDIGTGRWKGYRPILVRCTSATAADSSGVGAQCYPGVIVDLEPGETTQDELGTVWLTLYGPGMAAEEPVVDVVYDCLLLGDVEAATDDTRPRAVSVMGAASGSAGSDCSRIHGLIRAGGCFTLSQVSTAGACSCVANGSSIALNWDDDADAAVGEDPIYGCPPGVDSTICDVEGLNGGAPKKWRIDIAGFTSPNENLNQTYTVTWSSGEVWSQTKNGVTVTLTRILAGWTLSIDDGDFTVTYSTAMAFCCEDLTFDLDDDDGTSDPPATLDAQVATACGKGPAYTPYLDICETDCDGPQPRLRLVPAGGTGSRTITCVRVGCGVDGEANPFVEFATADPLLCTEDFEECAENAVVFRVTCAECVPSTVDVECCDDPVPESLCVQFDTNGTGALAALNGMGFVVPFDFGQTWQLGVIISGSAGDCDYTFTAVKVYVCISPSGDNASWVVELAGVLDGTSDPGAATGAGTIHDRTCVLPFTHVVTTLTLSGDCDGATITVTVSDASASSCGATYNCLGSGDCIDPGDGSGEFATEPDCVAACGGTVNYNCIDGDCEPVIGAGAYLTLAACQAACGDADTWDCTVGLSGPVCEEVTGPGGEYETQGQCQFAVDQIGCESWGCDHPDLSVVVNGGTEDGSYTAVWDGSTRWEFTTSPGGFPGVVTGFGDFGVNGASSSGPQTCDPLAAVLDTDVPWGATDITLSGP